MTRLYARNIIIWSGIATLLCVITLLLSGTLCIQPRPSAIVLLLFLSDESYQINFDLNPVAVRVERHDKNGIPVSDRRIL